MKPSERIEQIQNNFDKKAITSLDILAIAIDSIIIYLDEEYEKNKPCECGVCKMLPTK